MHLVMMMAISSVIVSVKAVVFIIVDPSHLQKTACFLPQGPFVPGISSKSVRNITFVTEVNVTQSGQSGKVKELGINQGIDEKLDKDTRNVLALENCIS